MTQNSMQKPSPDLSSHSQKRSWKQTHRQRVKLWLSADHSLHFEPVSSTAKPMTNCTADILTPLDLGSYHGVRMWIKDKTCYMEYIKVYVWVNCVSLNPKIIVKDRCLVWAWLYCQDVASDWTVTMGLNNNFHISIT